MYRALVVSILFYCSEAWATTLADRSRLEVTTCAAKGASCVCSGSSTLATKASVNTSMNQPHHLSYDKATYSPVRTSHPHVIIRVVTIRYPHDPIRIARYLSHDAIGIAILGENCKMNQLITIGSLYCILCVCSFDLSRQHLAFALL